MTMYEYIGNRISRVVSPTFPRDSAFFTRFFPNAFTGTWFKDSLMVNEQDTTPGVVCILVRSYEGRVRNPRRFLNKGN